MLKLGSVPIDPPLILAPMAGITDHAYTEVRGVLKGELKPEDDVVIRSVAPDGAGLEAAPGFAFAAVPPLHRGVPPARRQRRHACGRACAG